MKRKKLTGTSGIYQIQSKRNGKSYVGSAVNVKQRVLHFHLSDLEKNQHYNPHIQNHVNKWGTYDLDIFILELCPKSKLLECEQFWLDKLQPQFNICKKAGSRLGVILSEETKKKFQGQNNPMYGKISKLHPRYGISHSERTKRKMRRNHASFKGELNPNYGGTSWLCGLTKQSDERVKQISERMKGNQINKGRELTHEEKERRSVTMKEWYRTDAGREWKQNNTGRNHPRYGKPRSEEVKKKISQTKRNKS